MTSSILKLAQSENHIERLRGNLLSFNDIENYVSAGLKLPAALADTAPIENFAMAKFGDNLLWDLATGSTTTVLIHIDGSKGSWDARDRLYELASHANMYQDSLGKIWHVGNFDINQWPFLTVELVKYCLEKQYKSGRTNTPEAVTKHLATYFPHISYAQLLDLYNSDLIARTNDTIDLPTLSDIMAARVTKDITITPDLPGDLSY